MRCFREAEVDAQGRESRIHWFVLLAFDVPPLSFQEVACQLVGCLADAFGDDYGEVAEVVRAWGAGVFVCKWFRAMAARLGPCTDADAPKGALVR